MDRHWAGGFSVIVPSYNRPRQLLTCVRSLLRLWAPADGYEVILVDDGSAPPVVLPQEIGARVKLIRQSNQGPAAARNAGARWAEGRYLAFIDDDCEAEPDWLLAFERTCRDKPAPMLLGGTVRNVLVDNPAAIFNEEALRSHRGNAGRTRWFLPFQ
ncbi:MAG: glycosyltransferase family 2 protein [Bryobacteraceae bacterium]